MIFNTNLSLQATVEELKVSFQLIWKLPVNIASFQQLLSAFSSFLLYSLLTQIALALYLLKFVVHGVPHHRLLIETHTEMQFLTLRVRVHELDDELSTLVLKTTRCQHDDMTRTEEYRLIITESLVIVRGVYGRPWIGKYGTMIDLFDNLYLIAYLDSAYRS